MATTATQPISLGGHGRNTAASQDINMASGSYTDAEGGSFNPASYTRHFLGSPMSFRSTAGSYNNKLLGFPGSVGSVTMGSPMDVHRDPAVSNALKIFEFQDELCRNYTCCGLHLTDLHALLEHFEDVHVVCVDQPGAGGPQTRISVPFEPQIVDAGGITQPIPSNQVQSAQPSQSQEHSMHQGGGPVDPDDMELEMPPSSASQSTSSSIHSSPTSTPSPPETLLATPLSAYASPIGLAHSSLAAAYPGGYPGISSQKPTASSSPPSPRMPTADPAQNSITPNNSSSAQRPSLALNLSGFSSSSNPRPALHSPFITAPPPPGAAWPHSHGAPDITYMGNMGMNSVGMGAFGGSANYDYQNAYGYNFPQVPVTDAMGSEAGAVDMGCVQPAMLFSTPSSPQSYQGEGDSLDDEDADAEFDIDIEEQLETPQSVGDVQKEVKKEKSTTKPAATSKAHGIKSRGPPPPPSPAADQGVAGIRAGAIPATAPTASVATSSGSAVKSAPRIGRPPTNSGGSSLLQSKPFKCPKPNCNKSYKQANGLKYHITHGSCNFAPPKDLEHVQAILERKRKQQQQQQSQEEAQASSSAASSGANTPRSGLSTPTTPSSMSSTFTHSLSVNTGATNSANSSALSSPVGTSSGSHFTSNFTPTPSSLSTALSTALSLSSPTNATSGYSEGGYPDVESSSLSRSGSYRTAALNTSNASSSSLINALTPVPTASSSNTSDTADSTATSLTSLRSTLSSLPPSELQAIEAEAERQLKPYACGVGDCPRRYKNMNGLRYHYQHSGDHGAIGLQWLASGKHECLAQRGDKGAGKNKAVAGGVVGSAYPTVGRVGVVEREGRKVRGGSSSKPTSRASSVSASRTGTPVNNSFPPPLPYVPAAAAQPDAQVYPSTQQYTAQPTQQPSTQQPQALAHQYQQTPSYSSQLSTPTTYQSTLGYPA